MAYPSDLTQAEYEEIKHYLPDKKCTKPLKWTKHQIINGMMFMSWFPGVVEDAP